MTAQFWSAERSRKIIKRIVVEGELILETPTHFGNGDGDDLMDMPLLVDPYDGKTPLLTGTSIAGALRCYLRERELGYRKVEEKTTASTILFGGSKGDDDGSQSSLIIDDAFGKATGTVLRDGVRIDPKSRTAEDKALFNVELWQAGTTFDLRFELLVYDPTSARKPATEDDLRISLATALNGFAEGEITLGMRKRRGYGRVTTRAWRSKTYDLTTTDGLLDWLENGNALLDKNASEETMLTVLSTETKYLLPDRREMFSVEAEFSLDGSLLIRSGTGRDDFEPDSVHLHAVQTNSAKDKDGNAVPEPVLSGTSLAGALRARALRIANTLGYLEQEKAKSFVDTIFGLLGTEISDDDAAFASQLRVQESVIQKAENDRIQNRVSLDRFTSGARDGALFNQLPVFGGDESRLILKLQLDNPDPKQIGLLLLLLKDLWTGDLPLGGEVSVGRGRLQGHVANIRWQNPSDSDKQLKTWHVRIHENGENLDFEGDPRQDLEECVTALNTYLKGGAA